MTMKDEQTQPMTAEEYFENWIASQKNFTTWKDEAIQFAVAYHYYRLSFKKDQQPTDPYYTDPATWPEWANWTAVDVDGEMWFYEYEPNTDDGYNDWWVMGEFKYDFSHNVSHNPDWRNSLRSREEVSRGK